MLFWRLAWCNASGIASYVTHNEWRYCLAEAMTDFQNPSFRSWRSPLLAGFILIALGHTAYGQTPIDCARIQNAVGEIPLTDSVFDWPKTLKIPGVVFPKWTKLDPKNAFAMIETNYVLSARAYYDGIEENNETYMLHGKPLPSVADWKKLWNRNYKPLYESALSKGLLEYEQTTLSGMFGWTGNIVAFRYRIKDQNPPDLQDKPKPEMSIISLDYSWEYVFRLYSQDGSYNDYLVGFADDPTRGEMAIIGKSVVIFDTDHVGPGPDLLQIVLNDPDPILSVLHKHDATLGELAFSPTGPSCDLTFGKN